MKKNLFGLFLVVVLIISVTPSSESAVVAKGVSTKIKVPIEKINTTYNVENISSYKNTTLNNQTNLTIVENNTIILPNNVTINETKVNSTNYTQVNLTNSTLPETNFSINNETNSTLPELNISIDNSTEIKGNLSKFENETKENSEDNSRPPVIKSPDEYENYYGKTAYYYVGNQKIASVKDTEVKYYVSDHLGSSSLVVDSDGGVVSEDSYYAYGQEKESYGDEKYKYTGKELDDESGVYYYGARYYDPSVGRFLSVDPLKGSIESPQSLNRYTYTLNNPMKLVDPDGRETKPADQEIGTALSKVKSEYWKNKEIEWTQKTRESLKFLYDSSTVEDLKDITVVVGEIKQTTSNFQAAAYYAEETNTIVVDTTSAKKWSNEQTMAIIGGHELGHAVQSTVDEKEIQGDWLNLVSMSNKYVGNKKAEPKASALTWDIVNSWGSYYNTFSQGQTALTDSSSANNYGGELRSTTNEAIVKGDSIPDWRKGMADIDSTRAKKGTARQMKRIWKNPTTK